MKRLNLLFLGFLLLFMPLCYAATNLAVAHNLIKNLDQATTQAKQKTSVLILFPERITTDSAIKAYYAAADLTAAPGYRIYIDSTEDCHGMHTCNIGSVSAEIAGNPVIYYDMNNQEITVPVILNNNLKGYYTPAHAMGDFWPTMLVWRDKNVLYTITWQLKPEIEKTAIIAMANSMITSQHIDYFK
jgi:hypothetical protein